MNKIVCIILLIFELYVHSSYGQEDDFGETRLFYRSEIYGGYILHTNGWGVGLRKAHRIDGYNKWIFSCDLVSMKHNKEIKQLTPNSGTIKRYTYGKLNTFTILRPAIGRQKIIYTKDTKNGVEISLNYSIGVSLGYVKPIYLIIASSNDPTSRDKTIEKYDPEKHFPSTIVGKASFFKGIEEGTFYTGIYAKFGLGFEFAPNDDKIRYVETGITLDGHYREIPIMAFTNNQQLFFTYYLNFFFGKKSI